jgi:hypothetical protein
MAALGVMLLAFAAIVAAGFCFVAGGAWGWLALALIMLSMGLEAVAFVLAGMAVEAD